MTQGVQTGPILPGRQAIVLYVLLRNANRVVGIDRLVDAVWDTEPPATARAQVRICVSALRANLGRIGLPSSIVSEPPGYLMRVTDAAPALEAMSPAGESPAHFGRLLRSHRQSLGTTQRLLAARSTVSVRAIRDLEHGRVVRPRRDTVRLIAAGLGLSGQARAEFERAAAAYRPTTGTSAPGTHRKRRPV
ncbi:helix-turn-helix domain-containing protein [Amycolatopsis sp. EV170708-02-1]|uniref:helix-turn-helix domain-containing protein n=1 Tax=Amycolatopsis sp. EV170708-02-1 TaxID=2919322 RepID=UPI001F0BE20A|nr:helix-turn-helix domain-containing protein [Amycolatopsis sp. EV170708-02-1]UMO99889.1 helix-turn-helix domain-containing protein [Amycolatopsis sp. EV170708-02-1]